MNIFPFTLHPCDSSRLFQAYVQKNYDAIVEKYGSRGWNGEKSWSYYEVDAEVLTATEMRFTYLRQYSPVFGAGLQETIYATIKPGGLDKFIEVEKRRVAAATYRARQAATLAAAEAAGVEAVYKEMFS